MIKSLSTRDFNTNNLSKSPSRRAIYINQQTNKREVSTIFHSPYKNGKRNQQYINPSFISSHLFYPKQYTESKQILIKQNYVPNPNEVKHSQLYQARLRKEQYFSSAMRSKEEEVHRRVRDHQAERQSRSRVRVKDSQGTLRAELDCLKDYRYTYQQQANQQSQIQKTKKEKKTSELQLPAYFQKHRRTQHYQQQQGLNRKRQMTEWAQLTNQLKQIKKEFRHQILQQENQSVHATIISNKQSKHHQLMHSRRNADLLSNILKQQMRVNQIRKQQKLMC